MAQKLPMMESRPQNDLSEVETMSDVVRNRANETISLQVSKSDGSAAMVLPAEVLERLNLKEGDRLYVIEEPDGTLRLSLFDQDYLETMKNRRPDYGRTPGNF